MGTVFGQIYEAEKKLAKLRTTLADLDAAIQIVSSGPTDRIAPRQQKSEVRP